MPKETPKRVATMSRAIMYSDQPDAEETQVSFDSAYRLGKDDQSYFRIKGVGEDTAIRVDHIPFVIECLGEVMRLDKEAREA